MLTPDKWESVRFTSLFLTSGLYCPQAESTPTHLRVTQTVSPHSKYAFLRKGNNMNIAIIISILSLVVSIIALYLTQLTPPKIQCNIGPVVTTFIERPRDGLNSFSTFIFIPTTFINLGSRNGSIFRAAITIHKKGTTYQQFFIQWRDFCSFHKEVGMWGSDEKAHQLSLAGKSTIAKWISFVWDSEPEFVFDEGVYVINFYYWDRKKGNPRKISHEIIIDKNVLSSLEKVRLGESKQLTQIVLDKELDVNKVMTEHEVQKLLGS